MFIDGPTHDQPVQKQKDTEQRGCLDDTATGCSLFATTGASQNKLPRTPTFLVRGPRRFLPSSELLMAQRLAVTPAFDTCKKTTASSR